MASSQHPPSSVGDPKTGYLSQQQSPIAAMPKPPLPQAPAHQPVAATPQGYGSLVQRGQASGASTGMSRAELSVIVDAVSHAKEGILKDLSQLLDDKLSGLDEVVVELIRSKSENDSLREQLKRMEESRNSAQAELSKFRPAAFGFFRKDA